MPELAWKEHGSGRPLLLVNGYGATGADWDPILLGKLAREFRLICPDNRGMGESELGDPAALSIEAMADDLAGLLDALGIERADVAGWSMGGFVAQALAAGHPERVGSLALLATDGGGPGAILPEPAAAARLFDHSGTPREQATRLIELLFPAPVAAEVDAQFGAVVAAARAALSPAALTAQEAAMGAWHATPAEGRLAAIGAPALVMAGEEDVVIPAANAPLLAAAIGAAELRTFPGAGHGFIAQEAPRVAGAIRDFATARALD
jgi:pimeloyl-ACP methyl ester carboxylesterase